MADLTFSAEQEALRTALSELLAKHSTPERVRKSAPLGYDSTLWQEFVAMGVPLMALPEDQGGGGAGSLELALVESKGESRLWRELVERYHYLGCRVPFGAHLRYWVRNRQRELACLLWTSPAWKMKPRDAWIGWSEEQRKRNLQSIVNHGRFLILPWVRVPGLASKILALSARQLPQDWQHHYGYRPLLLETLVAADRFRGTCYRAANWIHLGQTTGRGRMDREHKADGQAIKNIFVYPLVRNARQRLCGDSTR